MLGLFIAVMFAIALMPHYHQGINAAASSWPAGAPGAFALHFIPSPVGLVFAFMAGTLLVWLLAKGSLST